MVMFIIVLMNNQAYVFTDDKESINVSNRLTIKIDKYTKT